MESNGAMDPRPFFLLFFDLPSVFAAFTTSRERFMTCMVEDISYQEAWYKGSYWPIDPFTEGFAQQYPTFWV